MLNGMAIKTRTVLLLFTMIIFGNLSPAQDKIDEWGIGIISQTDFANKAETVNFPIGNTRIYDQPNGNICGIISKQAIHQDQYPNYYSLCLKINNKDSIIMNRSDLREITYEGGCLKYYEERDGFVRVLKYTYTDEVWIQVDSLQNKEFTPLTWKEFLLKKMTYFVPPRNQTIVLKISPDSSSETIIEMDSNRFLINLTGEHKDNWFKVNIKEYSRYFLEVSSETPKLYQGWIQAIDDQGHPLIWYYTRGC